MSNDANRINTSTQIRNFYSEGLSYMNVKFYNTNLSFNLYPFVSRDATGKSSYDMNNGQITTVNFEGAYALYHAGKDIIEEKINGECSLPIPCAAGAVLTLERKLNENGILETFFTITKNGVIIPFKFQTTSIQLKENGQIINKVIESGLGAFIETVKGYLNGINADRHLDKFTDDFVKTQKPNNAGNSAYNNNPGNYKNNGFKKPTNNNYSQYPYKKNNQNYQNYQNNQNQPKQQNLSSYQIPN